MKSEFEKERLWSAYLDGELTAAEAAAYEESLTDDERTRLALEKQVEAHLAERLSRAVACPDGVWNRLKAEMVGPATASRSPLWNRWIMVLGAAAAIVLVTTVFIILGSWTVGYFEMRNLAGHGQ